MSGYGFLTGARPHLYSSPCPGSKVAFTLAEVLITLVIIGVVAILTISSIVNNYHKKHYLTAFKKTFVAINDAIQLSSVENRAPSKWDYTLDDDEFFSLYLAPYLKTTRCDDCWISYIPKGFWFESAAYAAGEVGCGDYYDKQCYTEFHTLEDAENWQVGDSDLCFGNCRYELRSCISGTTRYPDLCSAWLEAQKTSSTPPEEPNEVYSLIDGSTLGIAKMDGFFYLYLDVNGTTKPNKYGADKFILTVIDSTVYPYGQGQEDLTSGEYGCSAEGNGMYCGAAIVQNGWKYPENYPEL